MDVQQSSAAGVEQALAPRDDSRPNRAVRLGCL